ncbi:hypothetical protein MmiAt1_03530 [Methanimicrococcus sp. At1]|uniref:Uncharacterized protein n=1 Tax=Methanimicrococcus hacksteinii TaxID=3028293 RepID=A0ABU3VN33_9EURY|nr:hypothetical protein [Methanimicrococcus sp. At1]MDV0444810.1 hypothetical protein [Methanimicrococcus sp. At1]
MEFMEIEEIFSSLEEIQTILEKDGLTWRMAADEDEADEEDGCGSKIDLGAASFSADADEIEIEKWETELPDIDENGEEEDEEKSEGDDEEEEKGLSEDSAENRIKESMIENADVIYFDTFKKRTYAKTFIFQKEEENGNRIYRLIGFCEAPMT